MYTEIILALIQAATEFLPISSSGHLALFGSYIGSVDLFYITLLHLASVLAIILYTKDELLELTNINKKEVQTQWKYLIIGIIPAGLVGFFGHSLIERAFTTSLAIGLGFICTGTILVLSSFFQNTTGKLTTKRSLIIGLSQILALFPGVSRSGTTISFGLFSGLKKETAFRFSFIMAIPLILAAGLLNLTFSGITLSMIVGFIICTFGSFYALKLLEISLKKNYFWVFGIYCLCLGLGILLI